MEPRGTWGAAQRTNTPIFPPMSMTVSLGRSFKADTSVAAALKDFPSQVFGKRAHRFGREMANRSIGESNV